LPPDIISNVAKATAGREMKMQQEAFEQFCVMADRLLIPGLASNAFNRRKKKLIVVRAHAVAFGDRRNVQ